MIISTAHLHSSDFKESLVDLRIHLSRVGLCEGVIDHASINLILHHLLLEVGNNLSHSISIHSTSCHWNHESILIDQFHGDGSLLHRLHLQNLSYLSMMTRTTTLLKNDICKKRLHIRSHALKTVDRILKHHARLALRLQNSKTGSL